MQDNQMMWVPATEEPLDEATLTAISFKAPQGTKVDSLLIWDLMAGKFNRLIRESEEELEALQIIPEIAEAAREAGGRPGAAIVETEAVRGLLSKIVMEKSPVKPSIHSRKLHRQESLRSLMEVIAAQ